MKPFFSLSGSLRSNAFFAFQITIELFFKNNLEKIGGDFAIRFLEPKTTLKLLTKPFVFTLFHFQETFPH